MAACAPSARRREGMPMTNLSPSAGLQQQKQELATQMLASIEGAPASSGDSTGLTTNPRRRWNAMARKALIAEGKLGAGSDQPTPEPDAEMPGLADWASKVIQLARTRFLEAGAPIRRDEYWKYTDPSRCTTPRLTNGGPDAAGGSTGEPAADAIPGVSISRNPMENVNMVPLLVSDAGVVGDIVEVNGLTVESLGSILVRSEHWAQELYGRLEASGQQPVPRPLAALNTAVAPEGAVLDITRSVATPIHIIREMSPRGGTCFGRVLVRVAPGATATVVDSDFGAGTRNIVVEVDVGAGGCLNLIRAQIGDERVETTATFVRLAAKAEYRGFALSLDGELTRNETIMTLVGESARGHVAGGILGRGSTVIDSTVFVTHVAEGCESRQVFKSVLDDEARGVFQGKVLVESAAQKTDGYQIAQAVLLDDRAEFDSKPELEIYADDVKCSHGSTAGALDEDALFYLRSRGLGRREAESLLVAAFVDEAIAEIENDDVADTMRALCATWMENRQRLAT